MNGTLTAAALGGVILLFSLCAPLWARTDADEARLETLRKEIDRDKAVGEADKIQSLAGQFNVSPETVKALRAGRPGWGETAIELAMAQRLAQTATSTYPTMTEALDKVGTLRARKMGWGRIANYLGFKLGPVVSATQQLRNELRRESTPEKPMVHKAEHSGKPPTTARAEPALQSGRIDRPRRAARAH